MIETERLLLRPWREADRGTFGGIINTPAMMRYFGGLMSPAECDAFLDKRIEDQRKHGMSYWAVVLRSEGDLIGSCGVRVADNYPASLAIAGMVEAGWRIGEQWWRRGFATEAAEASIAWLWRQRDVPEVAAWTSLPNRPSQDVMRKLGMQRRADLDFDHPAVPEGSDLRRHLVFSLSRPASEKSSR
jgi:RimJ/RimL family protein N-acetyltransferase